MGLDMHEPQEDSSGRKQESPAPESCQDDNPPDDRVECRLVGDQLVIYISPGPSKRGRKLFFFGAVWLIFTGGFTVSAIFSDNQYNLLASILILGVFWAFGLGMLYIWFRARFGKTYVLVERDRLVIKFELLGREKFREYTLDEESEAELVVSYEDNRHPVYAVSVCTTTRDAKFGTFLSDETKEWLVARIDRHLGR
jgi:hypothetical protein